MMYFKQEQLKQALQADVDRQQDLMFSKNFYLFLYNGIQFILFFTITICCLFGIILHRRGTCSITTSSPDIVIKFVFQLISRGSIILSEIWLFLRFC